MSTSAVDLTKMSAAEIKAFIESQNAEEETIEQPRDEQGRFVSSQADPAEPPQADSVEEEAEPVVFEREIDLADGSGVQVFRGVGATEQEALAALADELVQAQANATKKIRELSQGIQPAAQPTPPPAPVDEANEFLLAQQLMDKPRTTIREMLKQEFGLTPAEIKQKLAIAEQIQQRQHEDAVAEQFMANNPDYYRAPQNATRLVRQLEIDRLPTTVENLQKVYNRLKEEGLIAAAPSSDTVSNRPRSSGLSTRSTSTPPPPKAVDTSKLTLDQLRELSGGYQPGRF